MSPDVLFRKFNVQLRFREDVYGGLPPDPEKLRKIAKVKTGFEEIHNIGAELDVVEDVDVSIEPNIFRRNSETNVLLGETATIKQIESTKNDPLFRALYIGSYQYKAALKQCASVLKITTTKRGSKQTFAEGTYIKGIAPGTLNPNIPTVFTGDRVFFDPIKYDPDTIETHVGHGTSARGKQTFIKANEVVRSTRKEPVFAAFQMWVLAVRMSDHRASKDVSISDLRNVWRLGRESGLGANRGLEKGKFDLVHFEEVTGGDDDLEMMEDDLATVEAINKDWDDVTS